MQIMDMTGYVLFWYLLGVKLTWGHAHKTTSCYLLGVTFKKSNEPPHHFYMGVPPGILVQSPVQDTARTVLIAKEFVSKMIAK